MYNLIFKNDNFIIVDKEANVLTVPSRFGKSDERRCLGIQLSKDFKCKIMPVHRLDFEVAGIVMFATSKNAQMKANQWFEKKKIFKTYEAICTKSEVAESLTQGVDMVWECMLAKGKKRAYIADFGKKAITHAKLVGVENSNFRFLLNPITGRSHQLRFEMYRHGYPIIGDELYGSTEKFKAGIALKAIKLDLTNCPEREEFNLPDHFNISGI